MLRVEYTPIAQKYFKKLKDKKLKKSFKSAIVKIRIDPYVGNAKTGDLRGIYSLDIRHNKVNYELAYRITQLLTGQIVVVIMAGTRENFYHALKRYME
ncbi:MAG: type II toxin-antitoxin system RelE/ParE family toxin [Bacillota bacterium]|nr:type II toxin-antitoxin system RelE/ParE family toxin [Bacillota bacterium]